jgi:hypothetical protein
LDININNGNLVFFKGPSRERIEKAIVGMPLEEKFMKAIENNILWLVKQCLDEEVDIKNINSYVIRYLCKKNHLKIVEILYNEPRIYNKLNEFDKFTIFWANYCNNKNI